MIQLKNKLNKYSLMLIQKDMQVHFSPTSTFVFSLLLNLLGIFFRYKFLNKHRTEIVPQVHTADCYGSQIILFTQAAKPHGAQCRQAGKNKSLQKKFNLTRVLLLLLGLCCRLLWPSGDTAPG